MAMRTIIAPNANVIARSRILAGLNKLDMAKVAGVPHSAVVRAERGQGVSPKTAIGISKALGMPFDELFTIKTPTDSEADPAPSGQVQ